MGNLTNKYIKDTYDGLIKLADESQGVQPTLQKLQDGLGNDLPAEVSSTEFNITGSLVGNADTATSASHALVADSVVSASYASNAGQADTATTASFALTASHAENYDDIYVTGLTFVTESTDPNGGELTISQTQGQPDITVDLDGRYQTLAAAQNENLRLGFIELATASLEVATASLNSYTASNGDIRNDFNSFTSSQSSVDSGQNSRLDSLEQVTGSFATTGSNTFTGRQTIDADLIVSGNLYVSGAEVIVSSSTLIVGDREIELNANRTVGNAGIIVYDVIAPEGTGSLQWDATNDYWMAGQYGSEERILTSLDSSSLQVLSAIRTTITAKNVTAGTIGKGTPCYITGSGTGGNLVGVIPADASNPSLMPAGVVLAQDLTAGSEGDAVVVGFINGINTAGFSSGDSLYTAVGGGYTNVKPTGSNLIQKIGNVEKVDGTNGSVVVTGPGRSNDVPNIQEGYFWVGNSDQVATATSTGSFARRDEENTFSQNQTINGSLTVNNDLNINAIDSSPMTISSGSQSISFVLGESGGSTQPELIFNGDNAFFASFGSLVMSGDNGVDLRANGGNATVQSNNNDVNIIASGTTSITGSNIDINGTSSTFRMTAPGFGEFPIFDLSGVVGFYSGFPSVGVARKSVQVYNIYENGFVTELWDSTGYNWGSQIDHSANGYRFQVIGSGSAQTGEIRCNAASNGSVSMNLDAPSVSLGNSAQNTSVNVGWAGPSSGTTSLNGLNVNVGSPFGFTDVIDIDSITRIDLDSAAINLTGSVAVQDNLTVGGAGQLYSNGLFEASGQSKFTNGLEVTGSIAQEPTSITIASATASIDFSQSNIQTLTLASGTATHLEATNMKAGQSVLVEITQDGTSAGTVTIDGSITFPGGTDYSPTTTLGGKDVLTLVSFDGTTARAAGQNDFS